VARFYSITLSAGGSTVGPGLGTLFSSQVNGVDDPGALNVEFDFFEYAAGTPMGLSTLTIEGVSLAELTSQQAFVGANISMRAGMTKGVSQFVQPNQAGLILNGSIFQAWGNRVGTEVALNFAIYPAGALSQFTITNPGNIVFNWLPGQTLQAALQATFATAFPNATPVFFLGNHVNSNKLAVGTAVSNLTGLGTFLKSYTAAHSPPAVTIAQTRNQNTIQVSDGSSQPSTTQLLFTDLIGQPTWVAPGTMQFMTVLRADVQIGGIVKMPAGLQSVPGSVTTTQAAFPSSEKYKTSFQGAFQIQSVRQVGNFRGTGDAAWATIFQAIAQS
jgi:hypothetical protein